MMSSNKPQINITHYTIGLSILSSNNCGRSKKHASAEARRMLSLLAGWHIGENDIAREARGRPFLRGREVDFSIAHSGALAAVSFVRGAGLRTGCDVERVRLRAGAAKIAEEFFSIAEKSYIYSQNEFDNARFYEIWTLKECFLKLHGLSVFDMTCAPSFVGNDESTCAGRLAFGAAVSQAISFRLYELSGGAGERYMLAAAIEGAAQAQPEIRWLSQRSPVPFACKMIAEIKAAPNPAETVSPKR